MSHLLVQSGATARDVYADTITCQGGSLFNCRANLVILTGSSRVHGLTCTALQITSGRSVVRDVTTNGILLINGGAGHDIAGWHAGTFGRLQIENSDGNTVEGTITAPVIEGTGAYLFDADDNHLRLNISGLTGDGVVLSSSNRNRICCQIRWATPLTGEKAGIRLESTSVGNDLRGSTIQGRPSSNQPAYGVHIMDEFVEDTILVDVNFGAAADYATAPFADSGTNTILTYSGGGSGDNIVL